MDSLTKQKRARKAIKHQTCAGAACSWQCLDERECDECTRIFKHVDVRHLSVETVDWIDVEVGGTWGLFTRKKIPENKMIILYRGKVVADINACSDKRYVMNINGKYVDAKNRGKQMYVNHSCEPNCFFQPWQDQQNMPQVSLTSLRDIKAKEELTVDYGKDRESFLCGVCNQRNCNTKLPKSREERVMNRGRKARS
jgi:hypothetical protein